MAQLILNQLKTQFTEGGQLPSVSIFYSETYPLIFFNILKKNLKATFFNTENNGFDQFRSQLSMSFLGSTTLYIINLSSLNSSNKDSYINFIKQYKGPNSLICFIDNKEIFNNIIDLDELIKKDVNSIFNFLDLPKAKSKIVSSDKLSIDEQIILHYYCMCLGRDSKDFESKWLSKIIKSEGSLFDLSSYFFSKNRVQFFNLWSKLENTYSDMFWISFWSEQIFKAFFYIKYRNNNDLMAAKKISYRLPFSFIQKDWKFLDINSLALAHKNIYDLDYGLKNGASNISLDLFFGSYFSPLL